MNDLRLAVFGLGLRSYIAGFAQKPGAGSVIVAAADPNSEKRGRFRAEYPTAVFDSSDYREVLARGDVDAVLILSPDFAHEEQAVAALRAKKRVFVEKPLALTVEGCDAVLRAAKESGSRLYVGHNMRHMAFTRAMKRHIENGAIGKVKTAWCRHFVSYGGDAYFKDWHSERKNVTGLLLQKAAHDIDVLHWLCGAYSRRVNAMGSLLVYGEVRDRLPPGEAGEASFDPANWPPRAQKGLSATIDVEDISLMQMELENGVLCSYQQCHFSPDAWRNYTVIGDEGRIENFGDYSSPCTLRIWNKRRDYAEKGDFEEVIEPEFGGHGGADAAIMEEFVRYAREGGSISVPPLAARQSVAAGFMATQSLRSGGRPFDLPPLPADLAGIG